MRNGGKQVTWRMSVSSCRSFAWSLASSSSALVVFSFLPNLQRVLLHGLDKKRGGIRGSVRESQKGGLNNLTMFFACWDKSIFNPPSVVLLTCLKWKGFHLTKGCLSSLEVYVERSPAYLHTFQRILKISQDIYNYPSYYTFTFILYYMFSNTCIWISQF